MKFSVKKTRKCLPLTVVEILSFRRVLMKLGSIVKKHCAESLLKIQ